MVLPVRVPDARPVVRTDQLLGPRRHVQLLLPEGAEGPSPESRVCDDNRYANSTGNSHLVTIFVFVFDNSVFIRSGSRIARGRWRLPHTV